jgi:hypothetical protein
MRLPVLTTALLAALTGIIPASAPSAQQKGTGQIAYVLELYTSQGCSSCPPADQLLKSYLGRDDVLALSFNVDIWDKLGWKDTLAKPQYAQRQRAYARTRGDGNVYTPQTIINGMAHEVGSDRSAIDRSIKATDTQRKAMHVELAIRSEGEGLSIDIPKWTAAGATAVEATVWLVKFTPRVEVSIERGENAGRTIAYHNVVRDFRQVGSWMGEAKSARMTREALAGCTPGTCAVLLQQGGTGSILGAAWVPGVSGI